MQATFLQCSKLRMRNELEQRTRLGRLTGDINADGPAMLLQGVLRRDLEFSQRR